MRDYIEIKKDLVPYGFKILLADEWFEMFVNYNKTADMFTLTLYKDDEIVCTEPMVLNTTMFKDIYQPERFPAVEIMPYDASGTEKKVTFSNLGNTVFLTVDDEGEEETPESPSGIGGLLTLGKSKLGSSKLGAL